MPQTDPIILLGIGGLFALLGVLAIIWGKREEKSYYNAIVTRRDAREFLEHSPRRPEPGALKIGGVIAIAVGLVMVAVGGFLLLQG
ncbi:MAG: hypothetical protein HY530_04475 [Chloroflexi bacterium]|nr:hypothetical protein [Chloroflexota bacterium]